MSDPNFAAVELALASIVDAETGQPLSKSVSKFELAAGALLVHFAIEAQAERRAYLEGLLGEVQRRCPEVTSTRAAWPLNLQGRPRDANDPIADIKHVVLVMSGKGGVGKSTVCSNLALAIKRLGYRVGLLDADMYGPSVPTMFGITGRPASDGNRIIPLERFGMKLMSLGFLLEDPKSAVVWRGPMLHSALLQFVKDVAWGPLDFLLLDLPPGTGDVMLTLSQNLKTSGAVVVTTPQEVALQDVYKSVSMAQKVGIPILGVVENQSYFVCNRCSERHEIYGQGGGQKVAEHARAPLLGQIPVQREIREWGDAGTPIVQASPGSLVARAFCDLAEQVISAAENTSAGAPQLTIDRSGGTNRHLPISR